jgi:hypothetical protein
MNSISIRPTALARPVQKVAGDDEKQPQTGCGLVHPVANLANQKQAVDVGQVVAPPSAPGEAVQGDAGAGIADGIADGGDAVGRQGRDILARSTAGNGTFGGGGRFADRKQPVAARDAQLPAADRATVRAAGSTARCSI